MDRAGEELGRIVAFVRRRPWIMEEPVACCRGGGTSLPTCDPSREPRSNYFLDRLGVTEQGDTSLHRLCSSHVTPEQFDNFLEHMECHSQYLFECHALGIPTGTTQHNANAMLSSCVSGVCQCNDDDYSTLPPPPHIDQTNHQGVTALHVAVFRNSFHVHPIVQKLLKMQPSLASTPMTSCGSYPLHILCGHSATIRKDVLQALLNVDPSVVWKEDCNGDTPLSLLWKNVLRFRWAQENQIVLQTEEEMGDDDMDVEWTANDDDQSRRLPRRKQRQSWITMISPEQYVEYSLMLIRAALKKSELTLVDICRMPRCPPMLVQLILSCLVAGKSHKALAGVVSPNWRAVDNYNGQTPLHAAAGALGKSVTINFVPAKVQQTMTSLVDMLLDADPFSATKIDAAGRLALHYALEINDNKLSTETAMRFVEACPDSLQCLDPVTGLYPFALLAAARDGLTRQSVSHLPKCMPSASVSQNIDTVFTMLVYSPEVANYCW